MRCVKQLLLMQNFCSSYHLWVWPWKNVGCTMILRTKHAKWYMCVKESVLWLRRYYIIQARNCLLKYDTFKAMLDLERKIKYTVTWSYLIYLIYPSKFEQNLLCFLTPGIQARYGQNLTPLELCWPWKMSNTPKLIKLFKGLWREKFGFP